jgi:hypothetical protein
MEHVNYHRLAEWRHLMGLNQPHVIILESNMGQLIFSTVQVGPVLYLVSHYFSRTLLMMLGGRVWTGLIWLSMWASGGQLCAR